MKALITHRSLTGILTSFLFLVLLFSSQRSLAQVPVITSFSPIRGDIGATVIIAGANFDATAANNIVFFGATKATVTSASVSSLTVTAPVGAVHAPITVLNATKANMDC